MPCSRDKIFSILDSNGNRRLEAGEYTTQALSVMKYEALEAVSGELSVGDFRKDFGHLTKADILKSYDHVKLDSRSYFVNGFDNLDESSIKQLIDAGKRLNTIVSEKSNNLSDRAAANLSLFFSRIGDGRCK